MIGLILKIFFVIGIESATSAPSVTFNMDRDRGFNLDIDPIPKLPFLLMATKDQDNINNADLHNINGRPYSYSCTVPCPVDFAAQNTMALPKYAFNRDLRKPVLDPYEPLAPNDFLFMQPTHRNQPLPLFFGTPGNMAESLLRQMGM